MQLYSCTATSGAGKLALPRWLLFPQTLLDIPRRHRSPERQPDMDSSSNNNSNNNSNTGSGGGDKNPPPSENARGKQPATRASLADAPRPPALWPWEWMPALGAIVHPQGCAICDAYLDHLAIERALGIRSLRRAEEARTREFKYDNTKYDEGFRDGLRVGRDDAAIAAAPDLLAEVARLQATVRALETQNRHLQSTVDEYRFAHGRDALPDDYDPYIGGDDFDDELASGDLNTRSKAVQRTLARYEEQRHTAWVEHREDLERLRRVALESRNMVRTDEEGDVIMRSPTNTRQQLPAAPPPPALDMAAAGGRRAWTRWASSDRRSSAASASRR